MSIKDATGIYKKWSPVNQAWFIMWGDSEVLRICNTREEADDAIRQLVNQSTQEAAQAANFDPEHNVA